MTTVRATARHSGVDAANELHEFADAVHALPAAIVAAAADTGRSALLDSVAAHRGGLTMGRLGTLNLTAATTGGETSAAVAMQATPAGAWAIVESGARPHGLRRARGLSVRPYGVFDRVNHPGVAGLYVWDAAVDAADTAIDAEAQRLADEAMPA